MVGKKVLVTGATSYIAAHVISELVARDYDVRATVRRQENIAELQAKYPPHFLKKVEYVVVPDIEKEDAFVEAVKGMDGAFHLASPVTFAFKESAKKELIDPAVNGTLSLLKAALGSTIKRIIITSSIVTLYNYSKPASHILNEEQWNPVTLEEAETSGFHAYMASKKFAEQAAWDFVEKHKPKFELVTLLPPLNFGPNLIPPKTPAELTGSAGVLWDAVTGKFPVQPSLASTYIDVRDVAVAEILAYESPVAANQRYLISAGSYHFQEFINAYHAKYPGRVTATSPNADATPIATWTPDTSKAQRDLGVTCRPKEETIRDWVDSLADMKI